MDLVGRTRVQPGAEVVAVRSGGAGTDGGGRVMVGPPNGDPGLEAAGRVREVAEAVAVTERLAAVARELEVRSVRIEIRAGGPVVLGLRAVAVDRSDRAHVLAVERLYAVSTRGGEARVKLERNG